MRPADMSRQTKSGDHRECDSIPSEQVSDQGGTRRRRSRRPSRLADLAAATNIPRLVKHRRLIDGLRCSTARNRARLHDPARAVLASTLEQGLPQDRHDSLLDQAKGQLDEAAAAQGTQRIQPQHSRQWVQGTNEIFPFTTHERTFEACNDQQQVPKPTPDGQVVDSRLIIAEFWSDLPPAAFRTYVDPRNWPRCSPFWRSMEPLGPSSGRRTAMTGTSPRRSSSSPRR